MKTQVALFIACSALALVASAESYQSSSNNRVFNGSGQDDVIKACQSDLSTNNFDCAQNIRYMGEVGVAPGSFGQPQVGDRRPVPGQSPQQGQGYPQQGGPQGPQQGPPQGGHQGPPQGGPGHQPFPPQGGGGFPPQGGGQQWPPHGGPGWPPHGGGHGGGGYPPPFPPQQPPYQPPYQAPQPPYHPQPPQHSLPNGSYLRSCRNEEMNGSYLAADCLNFRGQYVYSQLDLNRCQPQSDIGNNNGRLNCAPR